MTYRLKLDLTGNQANRLYMLLCLPLRDTVERHPDVMPAIARLRDTVGVYGKSSYLSRDQVETLKLDISAHDEAVLALVLADSMYEQLGQGRTISHPFVDSILAIQREMAGYIQAREAATRPCDDCQGSGVYRTHLDEVRACLLCKGARFVANT